jgi:ribonuclease P protein component
MLPKQSRIPRKLFTHLIGQNQPGRANYYNSKHFTLRFAPSPTTKPHVAVSVSKKISKKAVTRNTIRRRVYSAISGMLPRLKGELMLFVARPGSDVLKGEDLKLELEELLLKSGLIVSEV